MKPITFSFRFEYKHDNNTLKNVKRKIGIFLKNIYLAAQKKYLEFFHDKLRVIFEHDIKCRMLVLFIKNFLNP